MIQPSNSMRNSSKEAALAFHAQLFINQSAVQLGAPRDGFAARELGRYTAGRQRQIRRFVAKADHG